MNNQFKRYYQNLADIIAIQYQMVELGISLREVFFPGIAIYEGDTPFAELNHSNLSELLLANSKANAYLPVQAMLRSSVRNPLHHINSHMIGDEVDFAAPYIHHIIQKPFFRELVAETNELALQYSPFMSGKELTLATKNVIDAGIGTASEVLTQQGLVLGELANPLTAIQSAATPIEMIRFLEEGFGIGPSTKPLSSRNWEGFDFTNTKHGLNEKFIHELRTGKKVWVCPAAHTISLEAKQFLSTCMAEINSDSPYVNLDGSMISMASTRVYSTINTVREWYHALPQELKDWIPENDREILSGFVYTIWEESKKNSEGQSPNSEHNTSLGNCPMNDSESRDHNSKRRK